MTMTKKECIALLYKGPISREIEKKWHARISNAIKKGLLPNEATIDPDEFIRWAHENWIDDLAEESNSYATAVPLKRRPDDMPETGPQYPPTEEMKAGIGNVYVTLPPAKDATKEEIAELLEATQIALNQKEQVLATVSRESEGLQRRFNKCVDAGKKGGRGNAK